MLQQKYVNYVAVMKAVSMLNILEHYGCASKFKHSGDSLIGPCPIHNGTDPTQFHINMSMNQWDCFGKCKHGGNMLDFVSYKEQISIRESALKIIEWFHLEHAWQDCTGPGTQGQDCIGDYSKVCVS